MDKKKVATIIKKAGNPARITGLILFVVGLILGTLLSAKADTTGTRLAGFFIAGGVIFIPGALVLIVNYKESREAIADAAEVLGTVVSLREWNFQGSTSTCVYLQITNLPGEIYYASIDVPYPIEKLKVKIDEPVTTLYCPNMTNKMVFINARKDQWFVGKYETEKSG